MDGVDSRGLPGGITSGDSGADSGVLGMRPDRRTQRLRCEGRFAGVAETCDGTARGAHVLLARKCAILTGAAIMGEWRWV